MGCKLGTLPSLLTTRELYVAVFCDEGGQRRIEVYLNEKLVGLVVFEPIPKVSALLKFELPPFGGNVAVRLRRLDGTVEDEKQGIYSPAPSLLEVLPVFMGLIGIMGSVFGIVRANFS